ncbi:prephenate dehydrogenase [Natranaerofaba carboxydovora]|uniref:prephenate dehydrogenase n=1 Tax=Natranaerofaba carboxydovora TaxID=2742683 RepID=UPI001F1427B0|nr:prephenate dehydrogenase [Natranaerofaba carboxydovora]
MKKIAVIGVGLIAGSLSWAIKKSDVSLDIIGIDKSENALINAAKKGIIDDYTTNVVEGIKDRDMIILGAPVLQIEDLLKKVSSSLKDDAVLIDVGSTKSNVCKKAVEVLPENVNFIGGHPMTGSELSGVEYADSELFINRPFILTPLTDHESGLDKLNFVENLLSRIGAKPVIMDPDEHDYVMASISHLPHFLAFSLVACVMLDEELQIDKELFAGGFRDTTRVAMGDSEMWSEIFIRNKDNLKKWVEKFKAQGDEIINMVENDDKNELIKCLDEIKNARKKLS